MIFGLNLISCKNVENTPKKINEIVLLKSFKTPIVVGAGGRGMKITLNLEKDMRVVLDSIVCNNRKARMDEVKKTVSSVWVESYFYNEREMVEGKGWVEYRAEGDSCRLFYSVNEKTKSLLVPSLELKQDVTLWE